MYGIFAFSLSMGRDHVWDLHLSTRKKCSSNDIVNLVM